MRTLSKACIFALLLPVFHAPAALAQSGTSYTLKHRSSLSEQVAHNPFWPIGWVKGVESANVEAATVTADNFVVTGISIAPTPLALINNKEYAEGETFEAQYGGQTLKIKVLRINDGSVVLQYQNEVITVPLKHPKLSSESAPRELPPQNPPMQLH